MANWICRSVVAATLWAGLLACAGHSQTKGVRVGSAPAWQTPPKVSKSPVRSAASRYPERRASYQTSGPAFNESLDDSWQGLESGGGVEIEPHIEMLEPPPVPGQEEGAMPPADLGGEELETVEPLEPIPMSEDEWLSAPEVMEDGVWGVGVPEDYGVWYGQIEATFLTRNRSRKIVTTVGIPSIAFDPNRGFVQIQQHFQGTPDLEFPLSPGMRALVGRDLFVDIINRQHSLELSYFGLNTWSESHSFQGSRVTAGGDEFGDLFPLVTVPNFQFPFAVPGTVGGFSRADAHAIDYASDLNNVELNYHVRELLGRDRMIPTPDGSWTREITPALLTSMLGGVRYVSIDESFHLFSRGVFDDGTPAVFFGNYDIKTQNHLIGLQLGGDLTAQQVNWSLGVRYKTGIFANVAQQASNVVIVDEDLPTPNSFRKKRDTDVAFVGEFGFLGTYRLFQNATLRLSYDFMWVTGLALAPEQLNYDFSAVELTHGGYTLFQGFSVGCEWAW